MYRKLIPNPLVFQGGLLKEEFFELENLSEHDKIILGLYIEQGFIININSVEKDEKDEIIAPTIEELIANVDSLKADDLKIVAKHFDIEYTNKETTLALIKQALEPLE